MRRRRTGRWAPLRPWTGLFGDGAADPYAVLDDPAVIAAYVARWEGDGAAPTQLAARAQNSGIGPGDPLPALTDWSASGHHLAQATLAQQPTWEVSGAPDGVGAIYADGTSWLQSVADVTLPAQVWCCAVWQLTVAGGPALAEQGPNTSSGASGMLLVAQDNGGTMARTVRSGTRTIQGDRDSGVRTVYERWEWLLSGTAAGERDVLLDGVSILTVDSGEAADTDVTDKLNVLARQGGTVGATGYLRGLVICAQTASAETRAALIALLEGTS